VNVVSELFTKFDTDGVALSMRVAASVHVGATQSALQRGSHSAAGGSCVTSRESTSELMAPGTFPGTRKMGPQSHLAAGVTMTH
jgi:hypothetical protein